MKARWALLPLLLVGCASTRVDLSEWEGATHMFVIDPAEPGVLRCDQELIDEMKTCNLVTKREYGDFRMTFECSLAKGANNGVGIRMPEKIETEPAFDSFCEVQLIDDDSYPKLKPAQHTGSVYGFAAAKPGPDGRYAAKCGDWSKYEITVRGRRITVRVDGRLASEAYLSGRRTRGRIGFLGHYAEAFPSKGMVVRWRNVVIEEL